MQLTVFSINNVGVEQHRGAIRQMRFTLHSVGCQQQQFYSCKNTFVPLFSALSLNVLRNWINHTRLLMEFNYRLQAMTKALLGKLLCFKLKIELNCLNLFLKVTLHTLRYLKYSRFVHHKSEIHKLWPPPGGGVVVSLGRSQLLIWGTYLF